MNLEFTADDFSGKVPDGAEKAVEAEVVGTVESVDADVVSAEVVAREDGPADNASASAPPERKISRVRGRGESIRLARTGQALLNGAPSVKAAALAADYSPATAHNAAANGISASRALAAAARVFPSARKTLRGLRPKAIEAFDRALTLEDNERPDTLVVQAAGGLLKLAHEIGEDEPADAAERSATYYQRRDRFHTLRGWRMGARFALQYGAEAVQGRAVELAEGIEHRYSRLDAALPYGARANRGDGPYPGSLRRGED